MNRGLGLVFYGTEGVGKTSLAIQFGQLGPATMLSVRESGYDDLQMVGDIPNGVDNINVKSYEDLIKAVKEFKGKTLIVDSLMGVQALLFDYVCRTQYHGKWDGEKGFTSYWMGQRVDSPPEFDKLLDQFDYHLNHGRNVILIGHVFTVVLPNTLGADFKSHVVALDDGDKGGLRSCLMRWAPNVLFMNISLDIRVATEGKGDIVTEGKAHDNDKRLMYTTKSPGHAAKNRLHLPPVIFLGESAEEGFANFIKALPQAVRDKL